jgi:hypothetical protein
MRIVSTKKEQTREGLRSESMDREAKSMEQIREATRHYLLAIKELEFNEFEEIRMMLEQYTGWEYDLTKKEDTALKSSTQKKSAPGDVWMSDGHAIIPLVRASQMALSVIESNHPVKLSEFVAIRELSSALKPFIDSSLAKGEQCR